jgi:hypothetical protein
VQNHRLTVLVVATIVIALISTGIGLHLYSVGGAAQLDLSRPDYEGVNKIVDKTKKDIKYVEYPATGPVNDTTLREFDALFLAQKANVHQIDAFGGDPLSPESLLFDEQPQE